MSVALDCVGVADVVDDPPDDVADPSGELAMLVAMVPDGAASEEGAEVPDGAPGAEPEGEAAMPDDGVTAMPDDMPALVCPLSPAPASTARIQQSI